MAEHIGTEGWIRHEIYRDADGLTVAALVKLQDPNGVVYLDGDVSPGGPRTAMSRLQRLAFFAARQTARIVQLRRATRWLLAEQEFHEKAKHDRLLAIYNQYRAAHNDPPVRPIWANWGQDGTWSVQYGTLTYSMSSGGQYLRAALQEDGTYVVDSHTSAPPVVPTLAGTPVVGDPAAPPGGAAVSLAGRWPEPCPDCNGDVTDCGAPTISQCRYYTGAVGKEAPMVVREREAQSGVAPTELQPERAACPKPGTVPGTNREDT